MFKSFYHILVTKPVMCLVADKKKEVKGKISFICIKVVSFSMSNSNSQNHHKVVSEWVNEYTDSLFQYTVKRVSDINLAKDLVQDAFIAAYQSYHKFENRSNPKTWLTSILKNKIMDHFRQVYRRNETFIEGNSTDFNEDGSWKIENIPSTWETEHLLDNPNFIKAFDSCIDELPERWSSSIRIKYLKEETDLDQLGISKANYWKMLERARTQLRKCLTTKWFSVN